MITIRNESVETIDLLTAEEAQALPVWMLCCGRWWWLQSPAFTLSRAAGVNFSGSVRLYGHGVSDGNDSARPALTLSEAPGLEFGETVRVLSRLAHYIGNRKVLFCEPIFQSRFDERTNDYPDSEIKKKLDEWLALELQNRESAVHNRGSV